MAWVTPPTFTVGEVLTSALMNQLSGDLAVLQTYIPSFGAGGVITGTAPTAGTPVLLVQASHNTVTPASGIFTLALPAAFPTGLLSVQFTPAAQTANNDSVNYYANASYVSLSNISGTWYRAGSLYSGTSYLSYIAIGC